MKSDHIDEISNALSKVNLGPAVIDVALDTDDEGAQARFLDIALSGVDAAKMRLSRARVLEGLAHIGMLSGIDDAERPFGRPAFVLEFFDRISMTLRDITVDTNNATPEPEQGDANPYKDVPF